MLDVHTLKKVRKGNICTIRKNPERNILTPGFKVVKPNKH